MTQVISWLSLSLEIFARIGLPSLSELACRSCLFAVFVPVLPLFIVVCRLYCYRITLRPFLAFHHEAPLRRGEHADILL